MFIGHFGVGFAAKRLGERISLGTLLMAAQFVDLLWPLFLLLGIERVTIDPGNTVVTPLNFVYYPFTHSLAGVLVWAILFALVHFLLRKNVRNAMLLGGLVVSHWLLDLVVHRPDLPLLPDDSIMLGFGAWNSLTLTLLIEALIFVGGILIYMESTRATDRIGRWSVWGLIVFLALVYLANLLGPPPEAAGPIAIVGMAQWLLIAWGYWIDRHRAPVNAGKLSGLVGPARPANR